MRQEYKGFIISDDKELLDLQAVCNLLAKSYWADKRPVERIKKSIDNSVCYGIYHKGRQVGFARVVSDSATMYWLCDVIIDEVYRGNGLGKKLVEVIANSSELKGLLGILCTKDAHGLYEHHNFKRNNDMFMVRPPVLSSID